MVRSLELREKKSGPLGKRRLALMAIIVLATTALFILSVQRYLKVEELRLPDLVGMNIQDAKQLLNQENIKVIAFNENKANLAINAISSQSPKAGELVRRGRSVSLGVNLPKTEIRVPVLTGARLQDIEKILANYNLHLGEISYEFANEDFGKILRQDPVSGSTTTNDVAINIVVSRGNELAKLSLPQLVGLSQNEAEKRLRASGFYNISSQIAGVSQKQIFEVVDQIPEAGKSFSPHTRVTLNISIPSNKVVDVPSLIGIPLVQARSYLNSRGLVLGNIIYATDPDQAAGIISYEPSGFTLRGSPVEIVVNRYNLNEPISNLTSPNSATANPVNNNTGSITVNPNSATTYQTPTGSGGSVQASPNVFNKRQIPFNFLPQNIGLQSLLQNAYSFRLDLSDDLGNRTIIERQLGPGQGISQMIELNGQATLTTYINGSLFQSWNP